MHILLTNKARSWTGETAMVAELARRLPKRGVRVTLVANPEAKILKRLSQAPIDVLPLALQKRRLWTPVTLSREAKTLSNYMRKEKVDLVHSHASFDTWTAACAISAFGPRIPLVRTKHNLKHVGATPWNKWYYGRAIAKLIGVSQAVVDHLRALPFVDPDNVVHIPNGIALDGQRSFDGTRAQARAALGVDPDAELVVYISRLTERKDPLTLVRSIVELAKRRRKLVCMLAGEGAFVQPLKTAAQGCPAVRFLGHRDDVPRLLAAADLFVLPSLSEPFGLAPLEAMFHGVATILSDAEGFRDYAHHEDNALIFERGNQPSLNQAIERLLDDRPLRERLIKAGRETVNSHFHVDRMVDETVQLYADLLGSPTQ